MYYRVVYKSDQYGSHLRSVSKVRSSARGSGCSDSAGVSDGIYRASCGLREFRRIMARPIAWDSRGRAVVDGVEIEVIS